MNTTQKASSIKSLPLIGLTTAESISLIGNQIAVVAIPVLVLQYTNSPLVTGIASIGNIIPIVMSAIVGGRIIDRFGAWNASLLADLLSLLSVLALPIAFIYFTNLPATLIFLLVLLGALFDPTGIAARQTLVPVLSKSSGKSFEKVNSLRGGLENGADFLGPLLGGVLINAIGVLNVFFINAVTFLFCAVAFASTVPKEKTPVLENSCAGFLGLSYIFKHPQLRSLAIVGLGANFVILPFLGLLLPVLAIQEFDSAGLLGVWLSAFGLAAMMGSISFSWLVESLSRSVVFYGGLLIAGLCITLSAVATNPYQIVVSVFIGGLLLGANNPLEQTILQEQTPKDISGQVFTSLTAVRFLGGPVGLLIAGIITEFVNVKIVLTVAGVLLVTMSILGWYLLPLRMNRMKSRKKS